MNKPTPFEKLILTHSVPLRAFALNLTHKKEDAEDLFQETIYKALLFRERYEPGNLQGWLFTIMKHHFINNFRKKKNMPVIASEVETQGIDYNEGEEAFKGVDIDKALSELPHALADVMKRFLAGSKHIDIATELNIAEGTVKSRIYLARQAMQAKLLHYHKK